VHGALPLIHTQCCLFKVHGDYLDTRILNTPEELSAYPAEFEQLLDRIFDEFGLIVCGWSADWDEALRRAITRAPSRRFATYWAARGGPSASAQQLIDHRGAQVVAIKDADSFFASVQQQVESLEEFARPHPLSTEAAVASLKRYLSEPKYRIQLHDLVTDEVMRVAHAVKTDKFSVSTPVPDVASATARVREYEAASETLVAMAIQGGLWAEAEHYQIWTRSIALLAQSRTANGTVYDAWRGFEKYPATLLLYALGLGAVDSGRLKFLQVLLKQPVVREYREDKLVGDVLPPAFLFERDNCAKLLEGRADRYAPLNDWLHDKLRPLLARVVISDAQYTYLFDKFEVLLALAHASRVDRASQWYWPAVGAFGYRGDNRTRILKEIDESLAMRGADSPYVTSQLFGETAEECRKVMEDFVTAMSKVRWY
jgi:hypothetical protein